MYSLTRFLSRVPHTSNSGFVPCSENSIISPLFKAWSGHPLQVVVTDLVLSVTSQGAQFCRLQLC